MGTLPVGDPRKRERRRVDDRLQNDELFVGRPEQHIHRLLSWIHIEDLMIGRLLYLANLR